MKLFLTSNNINQQLITPFTQLVGKPLTQIKFALIENAADPYPKEKKGFVIEAREKLDKLGMQIEKIDLQKYHDDAKKLYETLQSFDVIWIGGGNVFYLRWILQHSGLDSVLSKLIDEGIVYGGESAGSVVAGPILEKFDLADDPTKAPVLITTGLDLTKIVIIPHWGIEKYKSILEEIKNYYDNMNFECISISDEQAVIIENNSYKII